MFLAFQVFLPQAFAQSTDLQANALRAQQTLLNCKLATDDARHLLNSIDQGMISQAALTKGAACTAGTTSNLNGFLKNFRALAVSQVKKKSQEDKGRMQRFIKSLRLQTLKSAMMTYLDAELRYNLNAPAPHRLYKVKTAARKFCENKSGGLTCDHEELAALESTAARYREDFHLNKNTTYSPLEAQFALNQKLEILNQAYLPVKDRTKEWKEVGISRSKPGIEAQDGIAQTLVSNQRQLKAAHYQFAMVPAREKYMNRFLEETQDGVGVLLYSKTMREKIPSSDLQAVRRVSDVQTVIRAVQEVKLETLKLAQTTNELTVEFVANQDKNFQKNRSNQRALLTSFMPASALFTASMTDFRSALKTMLKTNPIAAGQVLVSHPEFAEDVCSIGLEIQEDDLKDKHIHQTLQYATYGSMVVGGVMVASGFLAPAGVTIGTGAVAALGTLQAVNTSLGYALLVGRTGYTIRHQIKLHEEIPQNQQALLAKTGGDLKLLTKDEKEYKTAGKELAKSIALTLLPAAGAKLSQMALASEVMKDSAVVKSFQDLYLRYQSNPLATSSVKALDYVCARMHVTYCTYTLSTLNSLSRAQQQILLENPEAMKAFALSSANQGKTPDQDPGIKR